MKIKLIIATPILLSSCAWLSGPDGLYPDTKYDFLQEKVEEEIAVPDGIDSPFFEDHYPATNINIDNKQDVPKPRQIFSSDGSSSVQLRRLGNLMWIYIETLPSTSWPISRSYWDTSIYNVTKADPILGIITVDYDKDTYLEMRIEHGIKEASTEIFLQQVPKNDEDISQNIELIQKELENIVTFFAESVSDFSGTSLAAQNLNERKKANIFTEEGRTVIELNLSFDRAWSSVSRAIKAAEINTMDLDRNNGIFYVSYSEEDNQGIFSFLGFNNQRSSERINLNETADFKVEIKEKNNKSYVRVISNNDKIDDAEQLLSKINESLN
jgi:outer membrane protein assembly factor BamC